MRKPRSKLDPPQPQIMQPRCEVVLESLSHGLVGCQMLVRYMRSQGGPDWHSVDAMLDSAEDDFNKCLFWLKKRKHGQ